MEAKSLVYALHWAFCVVAIQLSYVRTRHLFHPHFMFTMMIVVLLSDFLMRGYTDKIIMSMQIGDVFEYQIQILLTMTIILLSTGLVYDAKLEHLSRRVARARLDGSHATKPLYLIGFIIFSFELVKRLMSVGWSFGEFWSQTIAGRGTADWAQAAFSGNFLFSLSTALFPLGSMIWAYLSARSTLKNWVFSVFMFMFSLLILVANGSRTPVTLCMVVFCLFSMLRQKKIITRIITVIGCGFVLAVLLSAMTNFRALGIGQLLEPSPAAKFEFTYHQDDSYYRAIASYGHAEEHSEYWDPAEFLGAILANPIPRALWENKPILDATFYGGYKLEYVTISFLGEIVAITGVDWAICVTPVVAMMLYVIFYSALTIQKYPMGFLAYLAVALYVYMCIRSLMNLTFFMYMPAAACVFAWFLGRVGNRGKLCPGR